MTVATSTPPLAKGNIRDAMDRFFIGLGQGFNAYVESRSRMGEVERLNAKSDEELAKMGLNRDDIPRHVFRDLLYL